MVLPLVNANPVNHIPQAVPPPGEPEIQNNPLPEALPQVQPQQHAEIQPDPVLANGALQEGGLNVRPGEGQLEHFVANHQVESGRDWDMNSAEGMLETARNSLEHIKKMVSGKGQLEALDRSVGEAVARMLAAHPDRDLTSLMDMYMQFKQTLAELRNARQALLDGVSDGAECKDPRAALAKIRTTMRVFRYNMQVAMEKLNLDGGQMGKLEGALRALQNGFTFRVTNRVTAAALENILQLEEQLGNQLTELGNRLQAVDAAQPVPEAPENLRLASQLNEALELSHRTNDQIRDFQDQEATSSTLRGIVGPLMEKGGSRKVEFSFSLGAMLGLGFSEALTAGVRVGGRVRVIGEINAPGPGRPITVTFRAGGGAEAKLVAETLPSVKGLSAHAHASAGAQLTHFVTRSYATLDDLLLDAKRCKFATSRTLGGAIGGALKSLGCSIGRLGTKFFRMLGRHSGEVKQDNAQYLQLLKQRGVAGSLDQLLAKRANPVVVAERKGNTLHLQGELQGKLEIGAGIADLTLQGNAGHEREFKVTSKSYAPVARVLMDAPDEATLAALMHAGPDGGSVPPIPRYTGANVQGTLANEFERLIDEAKTNKPKDKVAWARLANSIRTLMIATELAARNGALPRAEADRLLARFSNPSLAFPKSVYREYFMTGTGDAKPAKIRNSASVKFKAELFTGWSKGLTKGLANVTGTAADSFIKAVADGGVTEMRKQIGLDTTIQYRFSSEKPAKPGEDPRPWENVPKTTHELEVTASMPFRVIIDSVTRTIVNKGERLENQSENVAKDTVKGLGKDIASSAAKGALTSALPGLILATVKESAIAAVKKWLSDPANVLKLVNFCIEHAKDVFDFVVNVVQWVAEHPELTLELAANAVIYAAGTSSLGESERVKTLQWSFVDGQLDTFSVFQGTHNKMGVNVDPMGVGIGVGGDISYSVSESYKERDICPHPSLTAMLGRTEEFLFADTGFNRAGNGEALKNWLSRNYKGIEQMLGTLAEHKNVQILADAIERTSANVELQQRLLDARHAVQNLPPNATPDAKLAAAYQLLVALVQAYRFEPPERA